MRRREFIALFGTATAASTVWPCRARSQRRARIGVLSAGGEPASPARPLYEILETQLGAAGWHKGRNLEIDYRWGANDPARLVRNAEELVQSAPDVLLATGTAALVPLHKATRTIPIVFWGVSDPVAQGFVNSLAHPGGNLTGFSSFEPSIGSKWLQLLKDVAPSVTNVTVMFNPQTSPYNAMWMRSIEAAAPAFGVVPVQGSVHNDEDIRRIVTLLGTKSGSGLIVPSDSFTFERERAELIGSLATSNRLPAIYAFPRFVHAGGLIAYGIDLAEQVRQAADYVDRILKGAKAGGAAYPGTNALRDDHQSRNR